VKRITESIAKFVSGDSTPLEDVHMFILFFE